MREMDSGRVAINRDNGERNKIAVGKVFFNWIFEFEGLVKIKGPENVKKQYEDMVRRAAERINKE